MLKYIDKNYACIARHKDAKHSQACQSVQCTQCFQSGQQAELANYSAKTKSFPAEQNLNAKLPLKAVRQSKLARSFRSGWINHAGVVFKSERASVSIILIIITLAFTALALGLGEYSKIVREMNKLERCLALYSDVILSTYNRELLDRYGLFAAEQDSEIAQTIEANLASENIESTVSIEAGKSLQDQEILEKQILKFSSSRIVLRTMNELEERFQIIAKLKNTINKDKTDQELIAGLNELDNQIAEVEKAKKEMQADDNSAPNKQNNQSKASEFTRLAIVQGVGNPNAPVKTYFKALNLAAKYKFELLQDSENEDDAESANNTGSTSNAEDSAADDSKVDQNSQEYKQAESDWNDFLTRLAYLDTFNQELEREELIDAQSSQGIFSGVFYLIDNVDRFLARDYLYPEEKILLTEYILQEFTSEVRGPQGNTNYKTMSGQKMQDLNFSSEHEAEQIILGLDDEKSAKLTVNSTILASRLLLNYLSIKADAGKMLGFTSIAAAISTAAALFSAGTVYLDINLISKILCIIDALQASFHDLVKLQNGEAVRLLNDANKESFYNLKIYYIDYLRILSLFVSTENQLACIAQTIGQNISPDLYFEFSLNVDYKNMYFIKEKSELLSFS